ncbi:hypothetical protein AVEN_23729-1 [Araneus ventricosus]|uniref:Reverse transcriptase domain-containing protein n=1 Tax=Araneus ventricosus TaxID=182803 RepID=A0A4Y2BRE3_ARAVE|nr:hypothetical protein AVEN_23729-1 [Araneus ventricosus]
MEQGIIKQSESAFASPIHFVKKPNGDWRICGDFRKLNTVTIPDRYPLPHIQEFSHNLAGKTVFSKIDLVKAYHQIPVKISDIPKTAVITPDLDCFAYLDDILVASAIDHNDNQVHLFTTASIQSGYLPDSNFSLQQACHKFVMTRVQVCHKFVMTRVQACSKLAASSRKLRSHHETNLQQTCRANLLQIKAKTEYTKHNPG